MEYLLWAYVENLVPQTYAGAVVDAASGNRGGNTKFCFSFYNKIYPGSYSRVRLHLLQIKKKDIATRDKIPHPAFEQLCKQDIAAHQLVEHGASIQFLYLPIMHLFQQKKESKQLLKRVLIL